MTHVTGRPWVHEGPTRTLVSLLGSHARALRGPQELPPIGFPPPCGSSITLVFEDMAVTQWWRGVPAPGHFLLCVLWVSPPFLSHGRALKPRINRERMEEPRGNPQRRRMTGAPPWDGTYLTGSSWEISFMEDPWRTLCPRDFQELGFHSKSTCQMVPPGVPGGD